MTDFLLGRANKSSEEWRRLWLWAQSRLSAISTPGSKVAVHFFRLLNSGPFFPKTNDNGIVLTTTECSEAQSGFVVVDVADVHPGRELGGTVGGNITVLRSATSRKVNLEGRVRNRRFRPPVDCPTDSATTKHVQDCASAHGALIRGLFRKSYPSMVWLSHGEISVHNVATGTDADQVSLLLARTRLPTS